MTGIVVCAIISHAQNEGARKRTHKTMEKTMETTLYVIKAYGVETGWQGFVADGCWITWDIDQAKQLSCRDAVKLADYYTQQSSEWRFVADSIALLSARN